MTHFSDSDFAKKLYECRKERHLTRVRLAEMAGISDRSIINYENGSRYPNSVEIVKKLADALGTTTVYLLGEEESFVSDDMDEYGPRTTREVRKIVEQVRTAFAGGDLPQEDKDAMMAAFNEAYWESKKLNKYSKKPAKK